MMLLMDGINLKQGESLSRSLCGYLKGDIIKSCG
jgi:hypothetical protein